jgi:hypothetical protein
MPRASWSAPFLFAPLLSAYARLARHCARPMTSRQPPKRLQQADGPAWAAPWEPTTVGCYELTSMPADASSQREF